MIKLDICLALLPKESTAPTRLSFIASEQINMVSKRSGPCAIIKLLLQLENIFI